MCGICGSVSANPVQPIDRQMLVRMIALLRHRGPDREGFYVKAGVGLRVSRFFKKTLLMTPGGLAT